MFTNDPDEFDLIVMDYMMPDSSGVEVAKVMLEMKSNLPVVMITGKADEATVAKATDVGIGKVVAKPFDPEQLTGAIRELLDKD